MTIFQWVTFSWVYPLVQRGTQSTMNEDDVWDLSPTSQSRPVFRKFTTIQYVDLHLHLPGSFFMVSQGCIASQAPFLGEFVGSHVRIPCPVLRFDAHSFPESTFA